MLKVKNWFKQTNFNEKTHQVSLFSTVPCTYITCIIFGVPLSYPRRTHHLVVYFVSFALRLFQSYIMMEPAISGGMTMISINYLLSMVLSYTLYGLFLQKREAIVQFLSSASEVSKMKSIDRLQPLLHFGPILLSELGFLASSAKPYQKDWFGSTLACCPTVKLALHHLMFLLGLTLFQTSTLCMVMYALGYCLLHAEKSSVLTSISKNWKSVEYEVIINQLKSVADKQEHFECIFGPFLFICLCQTFLITVYLIYMLQQVIQHYFPQWTCLIFSASLIQVSSIGLIFFVSICNDRLKRQAASVSSQMEANLSGHSARTLWLIGHLQKKIKHTINEPLTACKMMTVDRQIVLSIAASCVSFSVLYIQINNGALNSK